MKSFHSSAAHSSHSMVQTSFREVIHDWVKRRQSWEYQMKRTEDPEWRGCIFFPRITNLPLILDVAALMGKASMLRDKVDPKHRKQLNFVVHVKDADPHRHAKNPFVGRPIAELRAAVEDALAMSERHGA